MFGPPKDWDTELDRSWHHDHDFILGSSYTWSYHNNFWDSRNIHNIKDHLKGLYHLGHITMVVWIPSYHSSKDHPNGLGLSSPSGLFRHREPPARILLGGPL